VRSADVAQLVEQLIRNQQVVRSNRIVGFETIAFRPQRELARSSVHFSSTGGFSLRAPLLSDRVSNPQPVFCCKAA